MKISFSTLGCPEWSFEDMIVTAKDLNFHGIELRGIENELYVPKAKPFLASNITHTKERLQKLHLEIPCLTSSCYLFDSSNIDLFIAEGKEYIDLAQSINTPYVRVLGDKNPEAGEINFDFVASNLAILLQYAEGKNVKILIETNGYFANSNEMLRLLRQVQHPQLGVLWDIHHPYRFMGEPLETTFSLLKEYISFVHMKDSKIESQKVKYMMMGYGDIPIKDAILLLAKNNYQGYISLEWVKRWCAELEEPGVVLPHFISYVKEALS